MIVVPNTYNFSGDLGHQFHQRQPFGARQDLHFDRHVLRCGAALHTKNVEQGSDERLLFHGKSLRRGHRDNFILQTIAGFSMALASRLRPFSL
jgi:hypothetical protein